MLSTDPSKAESRPTKAYHLSVQRRLEALREDVLIRCAVRDISVIQILALLRSRLEIMFGRNVLVRTGPEGTTKFQRGVVFEWYRSLEFLVENRRVTTPDEMADAVRIAVIPAR